MTSSRTRTAGIGIPPSPSLQALQTHPAPPQAPITPYLPPSKAPILATPRGVPAKPVRRISPAEKVEIEGCSWGVLFLHAQKNGLVDTASCNDRYSLLVTSEGDDEGDSMEEETEAIFEGGRCFCLAKFGWVNYVLLDPSSGLKGKLYMGHVLDVLVDGGSTHNFIHPKTAEKPKLALEAFRVYVGNGDSLTCQAQCQQVPLSLVQKHNFRVDLFVLAVHGHDVVLGVQWLRSLGRITHDYDDGVSVAGPS
ncbi:unnamed protein product [Cuscuta campestris]|uniref:Uncharacterized protein n=1 Tax=Cuscuta campestris TaxID=132261 RepID=A0A484KHQ8_9ASTE|nr:unnamed protein product [Cuscuta campestris]